MSKKTRITAHTDKNGYVHLIVAASKDGESLLPKEGISLDDVVNKVLESLPGVLLDKDETVREVSKKTKITTRTDENGYVHLIVAAGKDGESPDKDEIVKEIYNKIELPDFDKMLAAAVVALGPPKDGISPDKDEIIKAVLAQIELPKDGVSPDKDEIIDEVKKYFPSYGDLLKEIKLSIPSVDEITTSLLSKIELPKDGISPDKDEIIKAVCNYFPTLNDVANKVLELLPNFEDRLQAAIAALPLPKDGVSPDKDEIVEEITKKIRVPKDGKDSPLSEALNAIGKKVSILGDQEQVLLEQPIADGFSVITISTVGKAANGSGNYAFKTMYFLNCVNGNLVKIEEKPIYNAVTTNNTLRSTVTTKGNVLIVSANGVETSETTWKVSLIIE